MVRKTYSTLVAMAFAALVMVGCGKEDVSDLTSTWTTKDGEVQTKLTEVQTKSKELQGRLESFQVSNTADTMLTAERAAMITLLQANLSKISELEGNLKTHAATRDSLVTLGNRAEYETAWKSAETEYAGALASLDEIEKQNSDIASRLESLNSKPAAATTDTVAVKHDTVVTETVTTEKKADTTVN